jgi:hypothetical protein
MIEDIKYNRLLTFTGRNGTFKQSGLATTVNGDTITLEPITSRDFLANCQIQIPYGNIDQVIEALIQATREIEAKM